MERRSVRRWAVALALLALLAVAGRCSGEVDVDEQRLLGVQAAAPTSAS